MDVKDILAPTRRHGLTLVEPSVIVVLSTISDVVDWPQGAVMDTF